MQLTLLQSKIHHARVTKADIDYEGSISIDKNLIEQSGMLVNQQVDVLNITNGQRFTTYIIEADSGSGEIQVNGAAARLVQVSDKLIIISYASMSQEEAKSFKPKVIVLDENNKVKQ